MTDLENTALAESGSEIAEQDELANGDLTFEKTLPVPLKTLSDLPEKNNLPAPLAPARLLPLEVMFDVPITLVFEVGRTKINIKQLMELKEDSFIELNQVSVDVIDVRINEKLIANAETIALQNRYGIRMGELIEYSALENEAVDVRVN